MPESPEPAYPNPTSLDKMPPRHEDTDTPVATEEQHAERVPTQKEIGGPKGLEPTRYGDWEKNGRCIDF